MKTKTLISMLIALVAILVSSCEEDITMHGNTRRIERNYPYLNELNGVALVDSLSQRTYTLENFPNTSDARLYYPETCGVMIKVIDNNNPSDGSIAFKDLWYNGSLDGISGSKLSSEISKFDYNKKNNPALIKSNKAAYKLLRKRVAQLADMELKRRHDTEKIQKMIKTLVQFENK
jgi:hypothetical protein